MIPQPLMDESEHTNRFSEKLSQQLRFMQHSCDYFDNGDEEEALRIATCLRVLFHDKERRSTSISKHLDLSGCDMLTSARGYGDWRDYLSHQFNPSMHQSVWTRPLLGDFFEPIPLGLWWNAEPVFIHEEIAYSRRNIALAAANQDGGAHVDDELKHYYEVLTNGEFAIGIEGNFTYDGAPPFLQGMMIYPKNAHFALLRS